jgi:hypothetical protein
MERDSLDIVTECLEILGTSSSHADDAIDNIARNTHSYIDDSCREDSLRFLLGAT